MHKREIKPTNEKPSTAISTTGTNPWLAYGEAGGASAIVGDLLKFAQGDFLAGQDNREIPIGTKLVANMGSLEIGWIKWQDNRPVERHMGLLVEGFRPAERNELGDLDQEMWETDNDGNPRDPWQFTNHLVLANPDDGQIYTFVTSSKGGLNALGVLCKQYGQAMRQRPNEWPIVELGMGSYAHRDKSRGRIKHPTFKIVGWAPKDGNDVTPSPAEPPPIPKTSNTADAVRRF